MPVNNHKLRSLPMPRVRTVPMFSVRSVPVALWLKSQIEAYANRQETEHTTDVLLADSHAATPEISGDELLSIIDTSIRGYSVDVRDDLRSEIALAILSKSRDTDRRITTANINLIPATVRRIAKTVYRTMPDKFRHVSFEHCYANGQRLEERLAG